MNKKIRVFSFPWHVAHQHSLLKLPFEWSYLIQHTRVWSDKARPLPDHVKWVPYYESGKYDFALLHIDQQCVDERIAYGKTNLFKEAKEQVLGDIPIIVINHGTPTYPEVFIAMAEEAGYRPSEKAGEEWGKKKMWELLKDVDAVVVNSHQARKEWGFGKTIIHGLDPDEWWDLPKEPRIIMVVSPAGMGEKYYGRGFFRATREVLKEKYGINIYWVGEDGKFAPSWDAYRDYLGRSLVYFNPTIGSPMPRSRTEAMLSGCCIVTTRFHDANTFIEDGVNGFIVPVNPNAAADRLAWCVNNYKQARKIGENGRETAIKIFSKDRFQQDWLNLVDDVMKKWEKK